MRLRSNFSSGVAIPSIQILDTCILIVWINFIHLLLQSATHLYGKFPFKHSVSIYEFNSPLYFFRSIRITVKALLIIFFIFVILICNNL